MAVRLKSRWHRSKRSERNQSGSRAPKSLVDLASAVGINIWKLAKEAFTRMEKEGYRFPDDKQTIDVIAEFVFYQIHIVDRMMYGKVSDEERSAFLNGLAKYLAETLNENQSDLLGPGEYIASFIENMNTRFANYAECDFDSNGPSYAFTRYLAACVAEHMKISDDKWVVEQVMDIEAPEIVEKIMRMAGDMLGLK